MKKIVQILFLGAFLAGCSNLPQIDVRQLLATATLPPPMTPTDTETPSPSQTPIPTENLFATSTPTPLTFTPTVTMIGADRFTATSTLIHVPTATPGPPIGAESYGYFTPPSVGFITILFSYHVLYWDEGPCMPRDVKISAFVDDLINTDKVLLFMRLRSKKNTLDMTDWGAGAIMVRADNGSFNYDIHTWNLNQYYYFPDAWIEYQLVAYDKEMHEMGRSQVFDRNISLAHCGVIP